jgi:hypothetical protein
MPLLAPSAIQISCVVPREVSQRESMLCGRLNQGRRAPQQGAPFRAYSVILERMCVNTASVLQGAGAAFQMLRAVCIF